MTNSQPRTGRNPISDQNAANMPRQSYLLLFALFPLLLLCTLVYIYQPGGMRLLIPWVPSLDINLSLNLDALSFLFAGLISGIGVAVQLYALAYMRGKSSRFSFHLYLTLFMLAMLGLVLSDNILLLFVFWELTTLTSYLLIGFNHHNPTARKHALQSLVVTGSGGLALLAGLILLGRMTGSYELSVIISQGPLNTSHPLFNVTLLLILFGAFTKSAQFPFHFWLPNAMAAPTPVSAYLHSATMVKAGIYLLARLSPLYTGGSLWFYSLTIVGTATALWCVLMALRQTDLKLMLAYSTNVVLGKLTLLIGLGSELALTAALLFILAHSFYKASLFMVVGNIDKATGTRDINRLGGLYPVLLLSLIAAVLAALSKSGVPPLLGFLSKEYMYKAGLEFGYLISMVLLLVNGTMVTLALVMVIRPFFGKVQAGAELPCVISTKRVESAKGLWLPALLLAVASLLVPLTSLDWLNSQLVLPGILAVAPDSSPAAVKLWQGFNLPLLMSGVTLLLGYLLYRLYIKLSERRQTTAVPLPDANRVFDRLMQAMLTLANWQTRTLQHKRLSGYMLLFFVTLAALLLSASVILPLQWWLPLQDVAFYEVAIALLMVIASLLCAVTHSRLLAVAALGMNGFMLTLVFMLYSAPDVAKTLLLVETLIVVFVVLLMRHMPRLDCFPPHSHRRRLIHATVAGAIGIAVTALLISITADPLDSTLEDFFARNSLPGGHGHNIVNVILVDFRAFDTLGEVVVVVISAIAAVSLLTTRRRKQGRIHSLIFATTSHIVAALMLVFSVFLLLRGHNAPGGGFIGALIAVIGLGLLMFAESPRYVRGRLHYQPFAIALSGVALSLGAGAVSYLFGAPFLTGLWWKELLPLGTPLLFDLGVYLAVIGGVMGMLIRVNEELE